MDCTLMIDAFSLPALVSTKVFLALLLILSAPSVTCASLVPQRVKKLHFCSQEIFTAADDKHAIDLQSRPEKP